MTKKKLLILLLMIIGIIVGVVIMVMNYQTDKENKKAEKEGMLYQNGAEVFFDTDETTDEWDYIGGDTIPSEGTKITPKKDKGAEAPVVDHDPGELNDLPKYEGDSQIFEGQGDAGIPDAGVTETE